MAVENKSEEINPTEVEDLLQEENATIEADEAESAMLAAYDDEEVDLSKLAPVEETMLGGEPDEIIPAVESGITPEADPKEKVDPVEDPAEDPAEETELQKMEAFFKEKIRKLDGKIGELNSKVKKAADPEPVPKTLAETVAEGESFKAMASEFPEYTETMTEQASAIDSIVTAKTEDIRKEAERQVEEIQDMFVSSQHRNWKETLNTTEFTAWFKTQDESVTGLFESSQPNDVVFVLDKYKEFNDNKESEVKAVNKSKTRLEENAPPTQSKTSTPQRAEDPDEAFNNGFSE